MKKTIMTIALVMGISMALKSQTSEAEYQYITVGYKNQVINEGGDLKKGYKLTEMGSSGLTKGSETRTFTFKGLVRENSTKPCAIMVIYKKTDSQDASATKSWYACIPSTVSEPEIWQKALDGINERVKTENDIDLAKAWIYALSKLLSQVSTF